ncbi:MAG: hypothetical protein JNK88_01490 [Mangrovicoccus sp.]|nr:hypothetical protein [Mangrovicoccus sp.]
MKGVKHIAAGLVLALMAAGGAQAQGLEKIDQIGKWTLYFSQALGDSCMIVRTDAQGRQLQLGVDRKKKQAYAGLFAKSDTGMVAGKLSDVAFQLGETTFTGQATQYNKDGTQGGYVYFNNLNFAYELARQKELVITRSNGEKMVVDLTGSADAIDAMIVCQVATMK